jgi:hypothetical protein
MELKGKGREGLCELKRRGSLLRVERKHRGANFPSIRFVERRKQGGHNLVAVPSTYKSGVRKDDDKELVGIPLRPSPFSHRGLWGSRLREGHK